ncbi:hypothetical protein GCM10010279_01560 [Streptomyces mutabilis]|nr:hypothetical protein GCM10010279_01560 [Streptomyces mutabilis]
MAGEKQADDDAEQAEGVGLGAVEASGHVGGAPSVGPAGDGPVGTEPSGLPTLGEPNEYLQVQHLAMAWQVVTVMPRPPQQVGALPRLDRGLSA